MHVTNSGVLPMSTLSHVGVDGQAACDTHDRVAVPAILFLQLQETHRQRQDLVRAALRLNNQIEAVYRRLTGLTAIERARLHKQASRGQGHCANDTLIQGAHPADDSEVGRGQEVVVPQTSGASPDLAQFTRQEAIAALHCLPLVEARTVLERSRKPLEKRMELLVTQLPVYDWGAGVRGFGALGLAQIVAECGDLANYANPAKVWKRMGLAVLDGERQRKHTDPEKALLHGYNPQRRSIMYNIADSLMKGNRDGEYRTYYLAEKARQAAKHPDDAPIAAHNRALRHLAKRLLRDLWRAWNGLGGFDTQPGSADPPATFFAAD